MVRAQIRRVNSEMLSAAGLPKPQAERLAAVVESLLAENSEEESWCELIGRHLQPDWPFAVHQLLFQSVYSHRNSAGTGAIAKPSPAWFPTEQLVAQSNWTKFAHLQGLDDANELPAWASRNRAEFWKTVTQTLGIQFRVPASRILDTTDRVEHAQWFGGASLNITDSCFMAPPERIAIICQKEGHPLRRTTYGQLQSVVNRVANGVCRAGFAIGDRIGIMIPMGLECIAAFLGLIRAGCVPVPIAESFAAPEIEVRLKLADAKALFTVDFVHRSGRCLPCYEKLGDPKLGHTSNNLPMVVVPSGDHLAVALRNGHTQWCDFLSDDDTFQSLGLPVEAESSLLFSSGTTGIPKGIPWTQITPIKCASDAYFHQNVHSDSVVAWPTSLGWMMGPWLVYASMLNRSTMALYEGDPTGAEFCRFVQDAQVTMLGVVPSIVRCWRQKDAIHGLNWDSIELFSSTGECSNPDDMLYLMSRVTGYRPVIEYCGGTELGGAYIAATIIRPCAPSTFNSEALGLDFEIHGNSNDSDIGEVFLVPPSVGLSQRLINGDHHAHYFEETPTSNEGTRLRRHGDEIMRLPGGYFRAGGRTDDTMNLGGIKISAVELEQCLNRLPNVMETVAVAVSDEGGGPSQLQIFAVLVDPLEEKSPEQLRSLFQRALKEQLNPLFRIQRVVPIENLPRTASNKIIRRKFRTCDALN